MLAGGISVVVTLDMPSGAPPAGDELTPTTEKPLALGGGSKPEPTDVRERAPSASSAHPTEEAFGKPQETAITLSEEQLNTALYDDEQHSARTQWVILASIVVSALSLFLLYRFRRRRGRHRRRRQPRIELLPEFDERNTPERTGEAGAGR